MEHREVGRSGVKLSVVGFGTAQLQMLPRRQAIGAMRRGFELGVNWVHTAPDYGGVEHWIAHAIRESGEDVTVARSARPVDLLEPFFDNARTIFRRDTLDLYGVNCIEDIEYIGENVWGPGGIIDILQRKKREGKVRGALLHDPRAVDYMERLVTLGVSSTRSWWRTTRSSFTCSPTTPRRRDGGSRAFATFRERLFPLAAARGVSVIVMKPLAAGLLTRGRAFPPACGPAAPRSLARGDLLRYALAHPASAPSCPASGRSRKPSRTREPDTRR